MDKKVVIVHNIIAPYKVILFNELAKHIQNLHVVFIAESESRRDWTIDYSQINFKYTVLYNGAIDNLNNVKIAQRVFQILTKLQPDTSIICNYSNIFGWVALWWAKMNKNNLIFWLSSTYDDRTHFFLKEKIKQYFLRHFHIYLAPGKKTRQYFEFMNADRSKIITTGYSVDNNYYLKQYNKYNNNKNSLLAELNIKQDKNFIFVGRLAQEKNIHTLLQSFSKLKNNNWGLVLLGDGPLKNEIRTLIKKLKIENDVVAPGFMQQDEIVKYLSVSNVFILPSYSEPWGLVVNEALLFQLPVIVSSKCGCQPELVQEGINGFSFDPDDEQKLSNIMQGFIDGDYDMEKMGKAGLAIVKKHSPELVAKKIITGIANYI